MMTSKTALFPVLLIAPFLTGLVTTGHAAAGVSDDVNTLLETKQIFRTTIAIPGRAIRLAQANLPPVDESLTAEQAFVMGNNYGFGKNGYPKDVHMAARLYNQAARRGYPRAQFYLALAYRKGLGVRRNYSESVRLYRMAIAKGHSTAMNNMGFMYENGYGVPRDNQQARRYYQMAADRGNKLGRDNLARLQRKISGSGTTTTSRSRNWRDLPSYDRGLTRVQAYNLALKYRNGRSGYPRDPYIAARLYSQAARQGDALAMYNLGLLYRKGAGVPKDYRQTLELYRLAIGKNHKGSMNNMGFMYENGFGVPRNYDQAMRYYRMAANRGHKLGRDNIARLQRKMDRSGSTTSSNSRSWRMLPPFDRSLSRVEAFNLAVNYRAGKNGYPKDPYIAARLYSQAARKGDSSAMYNLALLYRKGDGVRKDYQQTLSLYRLAMTKNHTGSMNNMGFMYERGFGVPRNNRIALDYYRRAADKGNSLGQRNYDRLRNKMDNQ